MGILSNIYLMRNMEIAHKSLTRNIFLISGNCSEINLYKNNINTLMSIRT
jgi:hypothetical protein